MTRERGPRRAAVGVLVVLLAATGLVSWMSARAVHEREDRLLRDRAEEAASLLGGIAREFENSFGALAAVVRATGSDPAVFADAATTEVAGGELEIVGLVSADGPITAVGSGADQLVPFTGSPRALVAEALAAPGLVTDVFERSGERRLGVALAVESGGPVVYGEAALTSATPDGFASRGPFTEIEFVLYGGGSARTEDVVLETTPAPLLGRTARASVPMGSEEWTVVVKASAPLAGGFSTALPWVLLGGGVVVAGLASLIVEVRARRQVDRMAAQRATEAARVRNVVLAAVAHDLRAPLTVVSGFVETLRKQTLPPEMQADILERIASQAGRLGRLVHDLLDATHIESGQLPVETQPVSLSLVLDGVVATYGHTPRLRVAESVDAALPAVVGDPDRLERVLINLVDNAIKYSPEESPVTVSAVVETDTVALLVRDEGPGIDPAALPNLFEPFTQSAGTSRERRGGIGLGLYIARGFVESMGGRLEFDTRPGAGTTVRVVLHRTEPAERPAADDSGSVDRPPPSDAIATASGGVA